MILLVSPAPPTSALGNGVTAERWARILRDLGHEVVTAGEDRPGEYAALVALHARKSAPAIRAFRRAHPDAPVILALTGTDLYPDLASTGVEPEILAMADRFVVLQAFGLRQLDDDLRAKARVIVQSVPAIEPRPRRTDVFEVALLAHIRPVKDPLCAARATRLLPSDSRVLVTHAGVGLDPDLSEQCRAEASANPRYDWVGELGRDEAIGILARSRMLVVPSLHEGGANVISEALAAGVPVLASDIPGSRGLLGDDYPGYFPAGDPAALSDLLHAAETDHDGFHSKLTGACERLRPLVEPPRERVAWSELLADLSIKVPS